MLAPQPVQDVVDPLLDRGHLTESPSAQGLSESLLRLQEEELLCDVDLRCSSDGVVKAHKFVLAAASTYFRAVFTGPWSARQGSAAVDLCDREESVVRLCVKTLYCDDAAAVARILDQNLTEQSEHNKLSALEAVLRLLHFLDARIHQTYVEKVIANQQVARVHSQVELEELQINEEAVYWRENSLLLWKAAAETQSLELLRTMETVAAKELVSILQYQQKHLSWLPFTALRRIMSSAQHAETFSCPGQGPFLCSADACWLTIIVWASQHGKEGLQCLERLKHSPWLGIPNMMASQPVAVLEILDNLEARLPEFMAEHERAQAAVCHLRALILEEGTSGSGDSLLRLPTSLLACGGRDPNWLPVKPSERLNLKTYHWETAAPLHTGAAFVEGTDIPGGMAVLSGPSIASDQQIYIASSGKWERWSSRGGLPAITRQHSALTRYANCLYVLGGTQSFSEASSEAEVFESDHTGHWRTWKIKRLQGARSCHGAATLCGRVYVAGGQPRWEIMQSVESYDPWQDCWTWQPNLLNERKYLGLTGHQGRIFAIGGKTSYGGRLATAEALDPRDSRGWIRLPSMSMPRSSAGVAALDGKIYVVGGTDEHEQPLATSECFDLAAGKWMAIQPLQTARTGLALAVI